MKNNDIGELYKPLFVFCKVAEKLSFSQAAKTIGVSQPTVSVNIAQLEKMLGCLLFERRRPQLILTPDGQILYEASKPLVEAISHLPATFQDNKGEINHGNVALIAGEAVLLNLMPQIIKSFHAQFSGIRLQLRATIARDIPDLLLSDNADFALGSLLGEHDLLRQTPIYHFQTTLLVPRGHKLLEKEKITLVDVAKCRLIAPPQHSYSWQMIRLVFAQNKLDYQVVIEASSSEAAKRLVSAGLGVAIISEAGVVENEHFAAIAFSDYFPARSYSLIERRGKFFTPQAIKFREIVLQWAANKNP